jgi:hypothetical protein
VIINENTTDINTNERYWEPHNTTPNIKNLFNNSEIHKFYNETLNCNKIDNIENFLSSLYDYGAIQTYIKDDEVVY